MSQSSDLLLYFRFALSIRNGARDGTYACITTVLSCSNLASKQAFNMRAHAPLLAYDLELLEMEYY